MADYTQMHPPMVSASGLNPNLMVTGGPNLAGAGRWPADPASHLASHPWLPRPGAPSMWLSGSPYGTHIFFYAYGCSVRIMSCYNKQLLQLIKGHAVWNAAELGCEWDLDTKLFPRGSLLTLPDGPSILSRLSVLVILRNSQSHSTTSIQE